MIEEGADSVMFKKQGLVASCDTHCTALCSVRMSKEQHVGVGAAARMQPVIIT